MEYQPVLLWYCLRVIPLVLYFNDIVQCYHSEILYHAGTRGGGVGLVCYSLGLVGTSQ